MREYRDQLSIDTPEQVDLRLPLAGLGSRFLALLADTLLQIVLYIILALIFSLYWTRFDRFMTKASSTAQNWVVALIVLASFLVYWGYFALFEGLGNGQTPGKKLTRLRVIKDSGRQITLFESMTRNLLRIVDSLPSAYAVGAITILCNRRNKRIGDFAAGTIVVHEEATAYTGAFAGASRTFTAGIFPPSEQLKIESAPLMEFSVDAIGRLTLEDLTLLDAFFARIADLDVITTDKLTMRLLTALCAKMAVPIPSETSPRNALESIAYSLRNRVALNR